MASPNRVSEVAALFSPQLRSPSHASQHAFSPDLLRSPNFGGSPYRLPPIPKSVSGNDLVSGIVDKFNSLTVTDQREEEKARYERQIEKLKAALERATMAREEAEEEARRLREKLLEVQDERVKERDSLRERCSEYEACQIDAPLYCARLTILQKKYDKAKDRFKLQRAKNEEAMHKAQAEFLEKEKEHWRGVASVQEMEEWERKLRTEAHDLIDFVELERRFEADARRRRRWTTSPIAERRQQQASTSPPNVREVFSRSSQHTIQEIRQDATLVVETTFPSRPTSQGSIGSHGNPATNNGRQITMQEAHDSLREVTPEGPPSIPIRPFDTPAKQMIRVPVDFGEDKENRQPTVAEVLKTPMTMDRAAALAAIEYRRGRARSFVNAQMTPKAASVPDKRDVSAPAMVTMTVGRKR